MDEFAMGSTTETSAYGVTRNPWDLEHVPGGSSGGSCAAVAAGETYLALGSDTGGSIRQPSSYCGVTGIKPTYGTVSRYGLVAYASSLTRSDRSGKDVADCAALLEVIAGHDPKDSTSWIVKILISPKSIGGKNSRNEVRCAEEFLARELDPEVKRHSWIHSKSLTSKGAIVEFFLCGDYGIYDPSLLYHCQRGGKLQPGTFRWCIKYGYRAAEYEGLHDMYKKTRTEGFGEEVKASYYAWFVSY